MKIRVDHAGERFGRLLVLREDDERTGSNKVKWICRCDCGNIKSVPVYTLVKGDCISCGCYQRESTSQRAGTHRRSNTTEHNIWCGMFTRCRNPNAMDYKFYGARGIKVCERWNSFEHFYADMGPRPSLKHSIDRINNDGDYEPKNCRWITHKEQCRNSRRNHLVWFQGKNRPIVEISEITGVNQRTLTGRIRHGRPLLP